MKHINRPYPLLDFNEYKSYAKFSDDDESIAAKFYRLLENKARVYDGAKIDMLQVAFEIFKHYVFYKRGAKALRTKIVELLSGLG